MQNSLAKKIFAVGVAASTVLLGLAPLAASAAAHPEGTNILKADGTVGMIIAGQWRPYTSAGAFLSYGFNSWSGVATANADDLALPVGFFIPPQDGKVFCATATKGTDVKGECSLITGGQKAAFISAAVFTGQGFSFANAISGDSSFLAKTANVTNPTAAHLPGTLVHFVYKGNDTVFLVGSSGLLGVPDINTFNSWGYSFANAVQGNSADQAMQVTGVMAMRVAGQLSPTALAGGSTGTTPTPTGSTVISGSVSASLASDNPAAGTLVSAASGPGQVGADLAHFNFTGTGTITQVVVNRIGVSADTSVNNVYLYMGNNRITDAGSLSSGVVTFSNPSGLFTVQGSAEISVRVDVAGGVSGQTIGMQLASYTVANGTPESVSISGNLFNTAEVSNLATVTTTGVTAGTPGTSIQAGTTNAVLWTAPISVGERTVLMKYVAFKQLGSIAQNDVQNLKLMVDGSQVGSTASISSNGANTNVVIFDLSASPVSLQTGSHTIELHGDVVLGSSYTFDFSLQQAADVTFYDTSYNVNVPLTNGGTQVSQMAPTLTTISPGTVSVQVDPTFTATSFIVNQSQVTLGQWTMKAYGEDVKVQNLSVSLNYGTAPAVSADGFNNLSVFVNGGQVGSSLSALGTANGTVYPFGSSNLFTIPAGTTVTVAVKGDSVITNNDPIVSVRADLINPVNSLQGVSSFNLTPTTLQTTTGTTLTTATSNATFAENTAYTNQNLSANTAKQLIGSYVIQAGSNDGIRVSSLVVGFDSSTTFPMTSLANLYVVTPDQPNGSTPVSPPTSVSGTQNFVTNFTVPANQTATVNVYADIGSLSGSQTVANANTPTLLDTTPVPNVTGGVATKASGSIVLSGYWDPTDTVTATINGFPSVATAGTGASSTTSGATPMVAALIDAINANTNVNGSVTASASTTNTSAVWITANVAGSSGNSVTVATSHSVAHGTGTSSVSPSTLTGGNPAGSSTAQVDHLTPGVGNVAIGNQFTASTTAGSVTYTTAAATVADAVAGLVSYINGNSAMHTYVTATNGGTYVVVTANTAGVPFTLTSSAANGSQSASTAIVKTTMSGQGTGTISNQVVYLNSTGASGGSAQPGQQITIGNGSLTSISLSGSSPSSTFVLGGQNGQASATYTLVAGVTGGANVTELGFTVSSGITQVTAGGANATIVSGKALITGLNIAVPVGNAGIGIPVTVNYANVGSNGAADGTVTLTLSHVKYTSGNKTTSLGNLTGDTGSLPNGAVSNNPMYLVSTYPTLVLTSSGNVLATADTTTGLLVAKVAVTDTSATNPIIVTALPLNFSGGSATLDTGVAARLVDDSTQAVVATATITGSYAVTFTNLAGGNFTGTKTYDVYVPVATVDTSGGTTATLSTSMGLSSDFTYTDVNGNNGSGGSATGVQGGNGSVTYIPAYPTNQAVINNAGTAH